MTFTWLLLGLVLGGIFITFAKKWQGGERQSLAIGLVIAAIIYVGFAIFFGAPPQWLFWETIGAIIYSAMAWLGWRRNPIWLAIGWGLHPLWDAGLHLAGDGATFAPEWYVLACISFDLLVAGYVLWQVRSGME